MALKLKFQNGQTIVPGDSVYIKRPADRDFLDFVEEEPAWINVFGCRAMGKSSLCAQYISLLKEKGLRVVTVDVAAQIDGDLKTGRDWVQGFGEAVATDLLIDNFLLTEPIRNLPPNTATGHALERLLVDGVLKQCEESVLLVVDEYDYIHELDYCDEIIFAFRHIRSLQARQRVPKRLSICFVGWQPFTSWGTPGKANNTPFTTMIEMLDFTETPDTLKTIKQGFSSDQQPDNAILTRVLQLSGGQPLITIELLRQVEKQNCRNSLAVDGIANDMVASSGQGKDLQLFKSIEKGFVAEGGNAFAALRTYESLLQNNKVAITSPGAELLLLYGLVRPKNEMLEVKGELFSRRFDIAWARRKLNDIASRMAQYRGGSKNRGKKICLINCGGTLGMVQRGRRVVAPRDAEEFKSYFTSLDSIAEVVEFTNLFPPRDSINIFPDHWSAIARYIYYRRNDGFDGFVVAHGTDTMAYSASAVAFALGPQLRFPVVFTGAQTTPDVPYGDAHVNLYRACEVAKHEIPEVVISFGNFVYRAVRAQKKDDRRFDGFESPTYPPLAEITGEINVRQELLRRLPKEKKDIELKDAFEELVLIVPQFPGLEPEFFERLLEENKSGQGCHGVILQTLGAGNVTNERPYSFIPFVEWAYSQGIPVIVTSQYPPDPGSHTMYTPAQAPIRAGAIHAGNMPLAAAVTKFRWVLATVSRRRDWKAMAPDRKRELVSKLMVGKSIVGEF